MSATESEKYGPWAPRAVGRRSASHAGDLFRRRMGTTPTGYRRGHAARRFDRDDLAAGSGDLLQGTVQARGAGGEQLDDFQQPAADGGGGGDVV
jgi:hypothetical protein